MQQGNEYKDWKKTVDLDQYAEEAVKDEVVNVVEWYAGNLTPSQLKKIIETRCWELAHIYEGWSD